MTEQTDTNKLIERLREYVAHGYRSWSGIEAVFREAADTLTSQAARIAELEGALKPFAGRCILEPNGIVIGLERYHFECAHAALSHPARSDVPSVVSREPHTSRVVSKHVPSDETQASPVALTNAKKGEGA